MSVATETSFLTRLTCENMTMAVHQYVFPRWTLFRMLYVAGWHCHTVGVDIPCNYGLWQFFYFRVWIIAERISARQLITQAGWDFRFCCCVYICMYVCMYVCMSYPFPSRFRNVDYNVMRMLVYWGSRSLEQCHRMIGGVKHPNDERTIANSTFLIKQMVLSQLAFPRRGAWSSLEPKALFRGGSRPSLIKTLWAGTRPFSCTAACRVVLISIIAEVFNNYCALYEW